VTTLAKHEIALSGRHHEFNLELFTSDSDGMSLTIKGVVTGFMPLRSRRNGDHTYIGKGLTTYELISHAGLPADVVTAIIGFGMSEYLDLGMAEVQSRSKL